MDTLGFDAGEGWAEEGGAAAGRDGGATGSTGSEQLRLALECSRGLKRPAPAAFDEEDSGVEPAGPITAEAKQRKACREKARRENLNGLFHDLAVLLDKDHPKADKAGIVLDAAKALRALKEENEGLKQRNMQLERVNDVLMTASGSLLQQSAQQKAQAPLAAQAPQPVQQRPPPPVEAREPAQAAAPVAPAALPQPTPEIMMALAPPPKHLGQQQGLVPWWDLPFLFGEISELEDGLLRPPVA